MVRSVSSTSVPSGNHTSAKNSGVVASGKKAFLTCPDSDKAPASSATASTNVR